MLVCAANFQRVRKLQELQEGTWVVFLAGSTEGIVWGLL